MAFNSLAYALLLTFTVAWMAIGPLRASMLIVASLIFYAAAGPFDMLEFLGAVTLNWLIQVAIPADRRRIVAAVVVNIGLIGYFKYRNMLLGDTGSTGSYIDLALPLGISLQFSGSGLSHRHRARSQRTCTFVPRVLPVQSVFSATDCRTHRSAQSNAPADTTNLR